LIVASTEWWVLSYFGSASLNDGATSLRVWRSFHHMNIAPPWRTPVTSYLFTTSYTTTGTLTASPAQSSSGNFAFVAAGVAVGSSDSDGISFASVPYFVRNTVLIEGSVSANGSAVLLGSDPTSGALEKLTIRAGGELIGNAVGATIVGTNSYVENAGYIYGGNGIQFHDVASSITDQTTLVNTGTIEAFGAAIARFDSDTTETLVINNSGTIFGGTDGQDSYAFISDDDVVARDRITNTGKMIGLVQLGGGDDFLDSSKGILQGDPNRQGGSVSLGEGNDTFYGGAGADSVSGWEGNDIIRGGAGKDFLDGGAGTQDYIDYSDKTTKVELTLLAPNTLGQAKVNGVVEDIFFNFEAVVGGKAGDVLTGNAGSNNIAGGDGNDTEQGGSGNDSIFGGNGNDLIFGGLGNDQLTGNGGGDFFRFNYALSTSANLDTITDFTHGSDKIQLEDTIFTALTSPWSSAQFKASASGHVASTATQHVLYDQSTGVLWYDPDGSGAGGQTAFAKLGTSTHPTIDWTDFAIV
jgi:Ca2+-binding RTX toxin-like protein